MASTTFVAHTSIKHNGKTIEAGENLSATKIKSLELDVDALVAAGALAPEGEEPQVQEPRHAATRAKYPDAPESGRSAPSPSSADMESVEDRDNE